MPFERERAINWGREFLEELRDSGCVTDAQLKLVNELLERYPSAAGAILAFPQPVSGQLPDPHQQAILDAGAFFKEIRHSPALPADLTRQIPYVLRHFPY